MKTRPQLVRSGYKMLFAYSAFTVIAMLVWWKVQPPPCHIYVIDNAGPICLISSFVVIPLVGLSLFFINRKCRKEHSLRQRMHIISVCIISLAVWIVSCIPAVFLIGAYQPWPINLLIGHSTMTRLKERGFIPNNATQIVVRDSHYGFHGDGCMFVTFRCPESEQPWKRTSGKWIKLPLDSRAKATLDVVERDFSIPPDQLPDLRSPSVYYWIDDSSDRRDECTGHLYMQDKDKNQYWYFNLTT